MFYTSQVVSQISSIDSSIWITSKELQLIHNHVPKFFISIWGIERSLWRSWTMILKYLNLVHVTRYHSSSKMLATTSMDIFFQTPGENYPCHMTTADQIAPKSPPGIQYCDGGGVFRPAKPKVRLRSHGACNPLELPQSWLNGNSGVQKKKCEGPGCLGLPTRSEKQRVFPW